MYRVVVYEDDRATFAGQRDFDFGDEALRFAKLNQPCYVVSLESGIRLYEFGFEEEE